MAGNPPSEFWPPRQKQPSVESPSTFNPLLAPTGRDFLKGKQMNITATPRVGVAGTVDIKITDLPTTAESVAVRYVTALTPDNELGFKQVQNYKRSPSWHSGKAEIGPGGFPSGVLINVYCQEQNANQTEDVGIPSNAQPVICD
jgi:hypothetical protein